MKNLTIVIIVLLCGMMAGSVASAVGASWKENTPIVTVRKEVYLPHPKPETAMVVGVRYVGPCLQREEVHSHQSASDTPVALRRRRSNDDGRTWTEFETLPEVVTHPQGIRVYWGSCIQYYDPVSKLNVLAWLHQIQPDGWKGLWYNHTYVRTSNDFGITWGSPELLRYEVGDALDPPAGPPWSQSAMLRNQGYCGNNIIGHSNGTLICCLATSNAPNDPQNDKRREHMGSVCMIGTWNPVAGKYRWKGGKPVEISPQVSSRGLMEPEVAEMQDQRVLVIWRTSNLGISALGRKLYSVSDDGGLTLSEPAELKYDDGTPFYSPSAIHRMIRHSVTGKLYWIGNIVPDNPNGNWPRYPLVIAEVDETNVALKKDTVTLIDDRREGDSSKLQLSNFSVLENRQTHELEIYLTRLGEDPNDFWGANAYKYTLIFCDISDTPDGGS